MNSQQLNLDGDLIGQAARPRHTILHTMLGKSDARLGKWRISFSQWWAEDFLPGLRKGFRIRLTKGSVLEIAIIIVWALWVGRAYLNLDPLAWPYGLEFSSAVQTHYVWTLLPECGTCVLWNGFIRGGAPAFAEMHGSLLYPLIPLVTLVWGVVNGAKLMLVFSLIMAGIAQWWLIKEMGMGRAARLWCASMVVVSGHLAARMELGAIGVMLSIAACSLVVAPGLALVRTGKRRYAILLAITLALAGLSGQGYMQVGLVLGIIPAFLVFFPGHSRLRALWKEFALAGVLSVMMAAVLLVPLLHFYPNIYKNVDPDFSLAQSLAYIPLNLVINDLNFYYQGGILIPAGFPHLYANFLGWVPILMAILSLRFVPRSEFRRFVFILTAIVLLYLTANAFTLKLLANFFPPAAGVRHPSQISSLANPLILVLSGWGLEGLLKFKWPRLALLRHNLDSTRPWITLDTVVILFIPLAFGLYQAYDFGQNWLVTINADPELSQTSQLLKTETSEWIDFPFGEQFWMIPGFEADLKIVTGYRTWDWKDREFPLRYREGTREPVDPNASNLITSSWGINILAHPENEYAYIQAGEQQIACAAHARGGHIDVNCPDAPGGQLVVQENYWNGWFAWNDSTPVPFLPSRWLSVNAPAGQHHYQFRYRPWDVWLGIMLSLSGIVACIVFWQKSEPISDPD